MTDPTWRPPGWASKPAGGPRYLLISKDGVSAGKPLTLADRAMLFGRKVPNEPERGTVRLDHDSISRQHAAVVHSFTGETFVVDLGSRFGTAVDGEKLVPQKYTPIKDGAVLVFGASTRAYTFAVRLPKEAAGAPGAAGPPPTTATLAGAAGPSTDARPGLSGHGRRPPAGAVDNDDVDPMANYMDTDETSGAAGEAGGPSGGEEARRREKQRRKELKAELKAAAKVERKAEKKAVKKVEKKTVKKARRREGAEVGKGESLRGTDGAGRHVTDGDGRGEKRPRAEGADDGESTDSRSQTD